MKKALKILGIFLALLLIALITAPFLFKGSLESLLKKNINQNLNAQVSWESLDISLFKRFPDAAVTLKNYAVVNRVPFEGDTLASGTSLELDMGISQLFKGSNEPISVNSLILEEAFINIQVDSLGNANYDIAIDMEDSGTTDGEETSASGFTFAMYRYELNNSRINYLDASTQTFLRLTEVNHQGTGDLSAELTTLTTQTSALASLDLDGISYLSENEISMDADLELDLAQQKYSFLDNEARINALPLTFTGFVQLFDSHTDVELEFHTPSSDFKNFLAVIPKTYVKNLDGVSTTGDFSVTGILKGKSDDTYIPTMDIQIKSSNASFKYPDLPKAVRNISIDARLKNDTGLAQDTYLTVGGVTFKIDDEIFNAYGSIKNLAKNALIDLTLKGTLDLANIEKVLPMSLERELSGSFTADVRTQFDMQSLEQENYQNIQNTGTASLTNFTLTDEAFPNELKINSAAIALAPGNITVNELKAVTGSSDIDATGSVQNLIPWMMAKQDLKGVFDVRSNNFHLADFTTAEQPSLQAGNGSGANQLGAEEVVRIPDFLDTTLNFTAQKVQYDNLEMMDVKGSVSVKDEEAQLRDVTSSLLGGDVALSGNVSTLNGNPKFAMNLDLQQLDIAQSFGQLDFLKYVAPVAQALDGTLNTTLVLEGDLTKDMTPNLETLIGNATAQILTAKVSPQRTPVLSKLGESLSFLNLEQLSLQDVGTALNFNNGNIEVAPFDFEMEGIKVTAQGAHGLDKSLGYTLTMDVPARYLGGEVNSLLRKLDPQDASTMSVAIPIEVFGSFTQPKVNVNTQAAVTELTQKIIAKQKEQLLDKGTNILEDLIGSGSGQSQDSTQTQTGGDPVNTVKDLITDIFGRNKKKSDTTGLRQRQPL